MTGHPARGTGVGWFANPFRAFAQWQAAGGVLLFSSAILGMVWANSAWADRYFDLWQWQITLGVGSAALTKPLLLWINDGLMALFFVLVGLEIKRELVGGELSSVRKAGFAATAAIGGMVAPALIFLAFNGGTEAARGWGVPMATDIAFALGVLALLGTRAPVALKVLLAAIAIIDDIGAVLVIALFYTSELAVGALLFAALVAGGLLLLNRLGVRSLWVYLGVGSVLWLATLLSGVHATIAGVILAMAIPMGGQSAEPSPLHRLEHVLEPLAAFLILPIFALANAGVSLGESGAGVLGSPVVLGVALGLMVGKPLGILLFAGAAVRLGLAELPKGVTWAQVRGISLLCGIGFTMSIFIAGLAYPGSALLGQSKIGILGASLVCAIAGAMLIVRSSRTAAAPAAFGLGDVAAHPWPGAGRNASTAWRGRPGRRQRTGRPRPVRGPMR